ncbi:MAG: hypothetical protein QM762_26195 [Chryseolinea sp.]
MLKPLKVITWSIVGCFFGSCLVVVILLALSEDIRQRPGSFLRQFPPHPALEENYIKLQSNSYYLAGCTDHYVYLGNYVHPAHLIQLSRDLKDTVHVTLHVKGIEKEKLWAVRVSVDSPYFYVTDGTIPAIYRGSTATWSANRYTNDQAYFLDITPITFDSYVIRALGKPVKENTLGRLTNTPPYVDMKPGMLTKQVDGVFCTEGIMKYNRQQNLFLYVYRYRNEYIVLDTSLNIRSTNHTIDTTSRARITASASESTGKIELSSPPRIVNQNVATYANHFLINSPVTARNEHPDALKEQAVIDVYALDTHKYQFSFYVYDFQEQHMQMFLMSQHYLYALFDSYLQTYKLQDRYFFTMQ